MQLTSLGWTGNVAGIGSNAGREGVGQALEDGWMDEV